YSETESESSDSETEFESSDSEAVDVPLPVISRMIQDNSGASQKLTLEEKDSKFIREEAIAPLGLAVIPLTFTSNIKDNIRLNNKKSIMILIEVLVDKYNSTLPNYIMLGNNWFYGRKYDDDKLQTYIPEIVTDAEDAW
ncbi:1915_t:CDS:2, partial [Dentiscutata heterogama]